MIQSLGQGFNNVKSIITPVANEETREATMTLLQLTT